MISKIYSLSLLQGLMYLAIPLGIQAVITYIMAGRFSASLVVLCLMTVVATTFIGFFQLWQYRINETLHQNIFGSLAYKVDQMTEKAERSFDSVKRVNWFTEVVALQKGISKILLDFSFSVISILFGLLILPAYSSWFLIFTLLLGAVFYFIITYYAAKGAETNLRTSNVKYDLLELFQRRVLSGGQAGEGAAEPFLNSYFAERTSHYRILERQYKGIIIFKIFFIAVLVFLGAYLVQAGELNIGQFVASEIIIFLVINAVEKLVGSLNTFYDLNTALYKIEGIFKADPTITFTHDDASVDKIFAGAYNKPYSRIIKYSIAALIITAMIALMMPWTQSVRSSGRVTALNPANRPQTITSRISGRIEKWYIHEGDFVKKNDTIAFISEIKDEYVDPLLIQRSEEQIRAKETTLISYEQKINSVNAQIDALSQTLRLKAEQARNKIMQAKIRLQADSIESESAANNLKVAEEQYKRYEELLSKGVISRTDLENRKVKVQEALAKKASAENKYLADKNDLLNVEIELNSVQQDYQEKLMKAESEKFSALSLLYDGQGSLTKLQNQLANYSMRRQFYFVLAPQDGYITRTQFQGIGEIVKEGAALCNIVPRNNEQAVELFIDPVDLPLIRKGQNVQLVFDGWPAFVFSGWPGISYGTYRAEIVAFDRVLSENGKFRVLATNKNDRWPEAIQIGGGVRGFALLNNVPLFYELWRIINGFPPEFYQPEDVQNAKK